jgi:hypothetical protein
MVNDLQKEDNFCLNSTLAMVKAASRTQKLLKINQIARNIQKCDFNLSSLLSFSSSQKTFQTHWSFANLCKPNV